MKVLVLGCGPAGLIAAQAAKSENTDVAILSKNRKSFMKGAQYLHAPIPGLDMGDPFEVDYRLMGTPEQYRFKVYGRQWDGTVSPEDLAQSHSAWDIRVAYDQLWDKFRLYITDWEATPASMAQVIRRYHPDLVISSVPAPLLCAHGHTFRSQKIWSSDTCPANLEDNTVVCNGEESPRWYRAAKIQGWETVEWPDGAKPPVTPLWEVLKPTDNNCMCWQQPMPEASRFVRVGRYGKWQKGVLSHEAYEDTVNAIKAWREA